MLETARPLCEMENEAAKASNFDLIYISDLIIRVLISLTFYSIAIGMNVATSSSIHIIISLLLAIIIPLLITIVELHKKGITLKNKLNDIFSSKESNLYLKRRIKTSIILRIIMISAIYLLFKFLDTEIGVEVVGVGCIIVPNILVQILEEFFIYMEMGGGGVSGNSSGYNHGTGGEPNYPNNSGNNLPVNNPDTTTDESYVLSPINTHTTTGERYVLPSNTNSFAETTNVQPSQPTVNRNPYTETANVQYSQPTLMQSLASDFVNSIQRTISLFDTRGNNWTIPIQPVTPILPPLPSIRPRPTYDIVVGLFSIAPVITDNEWRLRDPFIHYTPIINGPLNNFAPHYPSFAYWDPNNSSLKEFCLRSGHSYRFISQEITGAVRNHHTFFMVEHKGFIGSIGFPYIVDYLHNISYKAYVCANLPPDAANRLYLLTEYMHGIHREQPIVKSSRWFYMVNGKCIPLNAAERYSLELYGVTVNQITSNMGQLMIMREELLKARFTLCTSAHPVLTAIEHNRMIKSMITHTLMDVNHSIDRLNSCSAVVGHLSGRNDKFLSLIIP